jgi:hypothetical protein
MDATAEVDKSDLNAEAAVAGGVGTLASNPPDWDPVLDRGLG